MNNLESMVFPNEFPIANPICQTDAEVQRSLLREHEQKFAELPEQEKFTKLCSNAGVSKNIQKDNSSLILLMIHLTLWKGHVESGLYLEEICSLEKVVKKPLN